MTQPANPAIPAGVRTMKQSEVTSAMTAWAVALLNDSAFPMGATAQKRIGGIDLLARVEQHAAEPSIPHVHRGITLYVITGPGQPMAEGVDVSHYQGQIDWKRTGNVVPFAFMKATEGLGVVDSMLTTNAAAAKAQGILRGGYHFFRPSLDAVEQAKFFLGKLPQDFELPPALDVEVADGISPGSIADGVAAFIDYVANATKRRPVIYTSPSYWAALPSRGIELDTDLWVAHWGVPSPIVPKAWTNWTFWQYSEKGSVPGISGGVDTNRYHGTLTDLISYAGGRAPSVPPPPPSGQVFDLTTVKGQQAALNKLGARPPLLVDGIRGPKTIAATKAFQSTHKDASGAPLLVDGVIGPKTTGAMKIALGQT